MTAAFQLEVPRPKDHGSRVFEAWRSGMPERLRERSGGLVASLDPNDDSASEFGHEIG